MAEDVSLLTDDKTKAKAWLADTTTWKDVYKAQPMEYLQIIANGDTPVWDKNLQKFIAKGEETEAEATYSKPQNQKGKPAPQAEEGGDDDDDQLPF